MMEISENVVAAIALVVLWGAEAVAPGLKGPRAGAGQRARHLMLGLLNALVSLIVVGALFEADVLARQHGFGALRWLDIPVWICAVMALCLLDLWQYVAHTLMHKVPLFWRFHAVHHNADRLEATAAMRFHTLEVAVQGLLLIPITVVLGIGIEFVALYHLILLPASMFHHADIRLGALLDRLLRMVIVTPRMHWIHHSRWQPETDSNYGGVLSVWDRVFGTMRFRRRPERVDLGLDGFDDDQIHTLKGMLTTPFSDTKAGLGKAPEEHELKPDRPLIVIRSRRRRARFRANSAAAG